MIKMFKDFFFFRRIKPIVILVMEINYIAVGLLKALLEKWKQCRFNRDVWSNLFIAKLTLSIVLSVINNVRAI